jgi:DNA-binding transcriptional MocR family regulator
VLPQSTSVRVDLDVNFPRLEDQEALLAGSLAALMRRQAEWHAAFGPASARGAPSLRNTAAAFFSRQRRPLPADRLLFAGNGKQAIAGALCAILKRGDLLGVEALTYPSIKTIADHLGIRLLPLPIDEEGLVPDALSEARRNRGLRAVFLQPTLHNPLGVTMSATRTAEIAEILLTDDMVAIEDAVWAFLDPDACGLRSLVPEQVPLIDSLSKRLEPGLTLGVIVAPRNLHEDVARALHAGAWVAPMFAQTVCARWMADGTVGKIVEAKRVDALARQRLARRSLGRFGLSGTRAYHCWLPLPDPWRADSFVAAAARHNIVVTPASSFAVATADASNAVRLALSAPPMEVLSQALERLAAILDGGGDVAGE